MAKIRITSKERDNGGIRKAFNDLKREGLARFMEKVYLDAIEESKNKRVRIKDTPVGTVPVDTGEYINSFRITTDRPSRAMNRAKPDRSASESYRSYKLFEKRIREKKQIQSNFSRWYITNIAPHAQYVEFGNDRFRGNRVMSKIIQRSRGAFKGSFEV